jgi:hypothetical protein
MYDRDRDGVTCRGPTRGPGHSAGAELYSHATMRDATAGSVSLLCTCTLACMHAPPDVIAPRINIRLLLLGLALSVASWRFDRLPSIGWRSIETSFVPDWVGFNSDSVAVGLIHS